jgi:hypothetical protein
MSVMRVVKYLGELRKVRWTGGMTESVRRIAGVTEVRRA